MNDELKFALQDYIVGLATPLQIGLWIPCGAV
jgi:hypothetical protein